MLRYQRNIMIPEVGEAGQEKIRNGKVLIIGTGGLGSPVAYYLVAAGVGKVGLVDNDVVSITNLQRQILHNTDDLDKPKVVSARNKLIALNPEVEIVTYEEWLTEENSSEIIEDYDVVVDCTDNFSSRQLLNQACLKLGKPCVYGAINGLAGQIMTVLPNTGPCYECVFGNAINQAAGFKVPGVLGPVPGVIGSLQAIEVLKILMNIGDLLVGQLLFFDGMTMQFNKLELQHNTECTVCGIKKG